MMRLMFQEAKLVHADLSEFNMLYHEGKVFFIDVSQVIVIVSYLPFFRSPSCDFFGVTAVLEYIVAHGCTFHYLAYRVTFNQSVEMDHPNALEFLRKDCNNVNEFFRKKNVAVLTLKGLFDFVTDPTITEDNVEQYLEEAQVSIEKKAG